MEPSMTIEQITSLLAIGRLAVDMHKAEQFVGQQKEVYYQKLREFSLEHDDSSRIKLDPRNEQCSEIISYSKAEYAAVKAAKRNVYNIKRRMDTAIRNSFAGASA